MRKLFLLAAILLMGTSATAQTHNESVFLEIGGASNMVGVGYEHRFRNHQQWGWRTGLGFIYTESSNFLAGNSDLRGWTVPLELNYLTGRRKSHLELGLGLNLGLYNEHQQIAFFEYLGQDADGTYLYKDGIIRDTRNTWAHFFYGNIGYRYQSPRGFQFRIGVSPSFNLGGSHSVSRAAFWPYLSFGHVF